MDRQLETIDDFDDDAADLGKGTAGMSKGHATSMSSGKPSQLVIRQSKKTKVLIWILGFLVPLLIVFNRLIPVRRFIFCMEEVNLFSEYATFLCDISCPWYMLKSEFVVCGTFAIYLQLPMHHVNFVLLRFLMRPWQEVLDLQYMKLLDCTHSW